jgi:adenine/guanine phosphoribosyltransferase-like PRPP-binding protein
MIFTGGQGKEEQEKPFLEIPINDKTEYGTSDLIRLARRNYKSVRSYVIINPLQGKHLPVRPKKALNMMLRLSAMIKEKFGDERILCIGFAETATAIGAVAACVCGCDYIHTTRERISGVNDYFVFSESHSRFTEQKICSEKWETLIKNIDRIVFVEDEISTGKTIMAIITLLRKSGVVPESMHFAAASIVNVMNRENSLNFEEAGIQEICLLKTRNDQFDEIASAIEPDLSYLFAPGSLPEPAGDIPFFELKGKEDPRRGVSVKRYMNACKRFAEELYRSLAIEEGGVKNILMLGTEEFMFPVLYAGKLFEEKNPNLTVYNHATTLSPISPLPDSVYPISAAYCLRSVYDGHRETFLYNLASYDMAVIATDTDLESEKLKDVLRDIHRVFQFKEIKKTAAARWLV